MHQVGKVTIYIGIGLAAIGLIVGFGAMILDHDSQAKNLLGLVPVGFVLMLLGTVTSLMYGSGSHEHYDDNDDTDEP